ncbi:hypothetical protein NM96_00200 [Neisseria mucosa]|uniref:Uncharacterized protein n=1 Tax=Neisseria mucosa TaxID=488 RepID=A0ABM6JBB4_NEIMU|nr:hypothetical protein A6J88_05640 [Neisseria mucosa]AVR78007.1 hypothetical protein NM96_00200 [Neisseria mucosa]
MSVQDLGASSNGIVVFRRPFGKIGRLFKCSIPLEENVHHTRQNPRRRKPNQVRKSNKRSSENQPPLSDDLPLNPS